MDAKSWTGLMNRIVAEAGGDVANYQPGAVLPPGGGPRPPGSGTEGDNPMGLQYINFGPLAFVLLEAIDSAVTRGIDRDVLIAEIAQGAIECAPKDVELVLNGKTLCPPNDLIMSFANMLAIDSQIIFDAAQRGGCKGVYSNMPSGTPSTPPGY